MLDVEAEGVAVEVEPDVLVTFDVVALEQVCALSLAQRPREDEIQVLLPVGTAASTSFLYGDVDYGLQKRLLGLEEYKPVMRIAEHRKISHA